MVLVCVSVCVILISVCVCVRMCVFLYSVGKIICVLKVCGMCACVWICVAASMYVCLVS